MAKGSNQKLKMLYLTKIFMEETDEQHPLTMPQLIEKLKSYGVNADRKTIYMDLEELRHFGLDIISEQEGRKWNYYLGARDFELPELKLLVDSVQSAKFMTDKKSQALIHKIESLASKHDAKKLQRQVFITGRVKTLNEGIYYNVDRLHEAIASDSQIRFKYYQWNVNKEMELRRDGQWYQNSPWGLMWDDENYYLVAYSSEDGKIRHYRVDKMLDISLLDERREGREEFKKFNLPHYTRSLFGMFGGEERKVMIEARNDLVGVMIDRFGKDIIIVPTDPDHFQITVNVAVSKQFLGWIIALGEGVRILGPDDVVEQMRDEARRLAEQYSYRKVKNPKVVRAETTAQYAAAFYVRIQTMAEKYHIPVEMELDEHDTDDAKHIVIFDDVLPVATGRLFPIRDDTMQFGRIVVLPQYRHQGLGSLVVREAEIWAKELGYKKAVLQSRDNKVDFYEKLGYQGDREKLIYEEPFTCVHMEKLL